MQGGIDPDLPVSAYADLVRCGKHAVPSMHVHAFSPMEIANGVTKSGLNIRDWLISLREAGLTPSQVRPPRFSTTRSAGC